MDPGGTWSRSSGLRTPWDPPGEAGGVAGEKDMWMTSVSLLPL